jgi:hypothetical protein
MEISCADVMYRCNLIDNMYGNGKVMVGQMVPVKVTAFVTEVEMDKVMGLVMVTILDIIITQMSFKICLYDNRM